MSGPLSGVRVLDLCQLAVGPLAGGWLGQLGADVIKVEVPAGDPIRWLLPNVGEVGTYYTAVNTNKRSISLDLKTAEDREVAFSLVSKSDVIMANFRPGVLDRLGLGYDAVRVLNPEIVYATCSGYGSHGPRSWEGGADNYIRMFTGFDLASGEAGQEQERFRNRGHVDHLCAAYFCQAILTALLVKRTTGRGQRVESSMMQSTVAYQWDRLVDFFVTGAEPVPAGSVGNWWPVDQAFATSDSYLALTVQSAAEWRRLAQCLGLDGEAWPGAGQDLPALVATRLATRSTAEWLADLVERDVRCAPFRTVPDLMQMQQAVENGYIETVTHPWGPVVMAGSPWRFSRTQAKVGPAPEKGQHAEEIRREAAAAGAVHGAHAQAPAGHGSPEPAGPPPLDGVRVLEAVSDGIAGSYAAMQLADLGAVVLKLDEQQDRADTGPLAGPLAGPSDAVRAEIGHGKTRLSFRRASPGDLAQIASLAGDADVVITDLPDGELAALGLDEVRLARSNPRAVLARASWYGPAGPEAGRVGSELCVQAVTGIWEYLGALDRAPCRLGMAAAETAGGIMLVQGILAALLERCQSGSGQVVEVSDLGAMAALSGHLIAANTEGNSGGGWHLSGPGLPPTRSLLIEGRAFDFSFPDDFAFAEFYRAIGLPDELAGQTRFTDKLQLILHWEEFLDEAGPYFQATTLQKALDLSVTYGGVGVAGNSFTTLVADEQLAAMDVLARAPGPLPGKPTGINPPWNLARSTMARAANPAPAVQPVAESAWPERLAAAPAH